jgi:prevent-host-death family protein
MPRSLSAKDTTTRTLRAHLRELLAEASAGKEIVVTLRGKPYVRIVPIASSNEASTRYPLRGSIRAIADDFDAPTPDLREPAARKPSRPARRRK